MLEELIIKDFALIDSTHIEFNKGFTVLSGETGAGKSILIGALSFLLGGKASAESIRAGQSEASVTGTFSVPEKTSKDRDLSEDFDAEPLTVWEWLSKHGIEPEDETIILRRVMKSTGKSGAWICGSPVTRNDLAEFSQFLVDIHGQHEHQSLMRVTEHRKFLDSYAHITDEVSAFTGLYTELVEKRKKLSLLNTSDAERERRIDYLKFSIDEIEGAKLKAGEDEELEAEEARLSSYEKLFAETQGINEILSGIEGGSMLSLARKLRQSAEHLSSYDKSLESLNSRIESLFYELSDISDEYHSYESSLVYDPSRLEEVHDRLDLIYKLKKKYASSQSAPIAQILDYKIQSEKELEELSSSEQNRDALKEEITVLEKKVYAAAKAISQKRFASAEKMSVEVQTILSTLGMKGAVFSVSIREKNGTEVEQKCGPYGIDDIEFLISANPPQPLQPLAKIASGGELSRVMLALKTIFAEADTVETLIFDEIDTGIGGEIAVAVGSHMKNLAQKRQILCITHLASIAVYADNQIRIQKSMPDGVMKTRAQNVSGEERVMEIARMLSGDTTSEESLDHARSMLKKFSGGGN